MGFGAEFYCPGFRRSAGISVGIFGSDFGGDLDFSGVKKKWGFSGEAWRGFFPENGDLSWRGLARYFHVLPATFA